MQALQEHGHAVIITVVSPAPASVWLASWLCDKVQSGLSVLSNVPEHSTGVSSLLDYADDNATGKRSNRSSSVCSSVVLA